MQMYNVLCLLFHVPLCSCVYAFPVLVRVLLAQHDVFQHLVDIPVSTTFNITVRNYSLPEMYLLSWQ